MKYFLLKPILVFLITSLLLNLHAQQYEYVPFPDSGVVWSEVYYPGFGNGEPIYERFALNGEDTVIENKVYSKLYLFHDSVFSINNATYFGGIREDSNKRVYFKGNIPLHSLKPSHWIFDFSDKEAILFDFSKTIGDTVFKGSSDTCLFNSNEDNQLIISKIDSILVGGTYRKRYYFERYFWFQWIEGIGNTMGLLFASGDIYNNGMGGGIICFQQNNQTLYSTSNVCYPEIVNINEKSNIHFSLKIYPQPAKHDLYIEFSKPGSGVLTIYNCTGQLVLSKQVSKQSKCHINLNNYKSGIYLVAFKSLDGNLYKQKIIVK